MTRQERIFNLIVLLLVSLGIFFFTIYVEYQQNSKRNLESLEMLASSFELTAANVVSNFAWDYVQWAPLQRAISDENYEYVDEFFDRAIIERRYIESIEVMARPEGIAEDLGYVILVKGNDLTAYVNLYDRERMNFKREIVVKVELDEAIMLLDLYSKAEGFVLDENGQFPFAFGLRVEYTGKLLYPLDWIGALLFGLSSAAILRYLYNLVSEFQMRTSGLERIMLLLERRDSYTINHSRNVALVVRLITRKLGLSRREAAKIEAAAKLHDIGKIAIPSDILDKNGMLEIEEYEQMKLHPKHGVEIIRQFGGLSELEPGILYHHERMDGSGYPQGLKEGEIPVMAQIIAVADVFESLISDRPYRNGLDYEEVVTLMRMMPINQNYLTIIERNHSELMSLIWEDREKNVDQRVGAVITE